MGLKKVIRTIETLPIPIVSGRMAMAMVCNIGATHAGNIDNWLRNRNTPPIKRSPPTPTTSEAKRAKFVVHINPGNSLWVVLMSLYYAETGQATVSQIMDSYSKQILVKYQVEPPEDLIGCLDTLMEAGFVEEASEGGRFVLTEYGDALGLKLMIGCPKRLKFSFSEDTAAFEEEVKTPLKQEANFSDPDSWLLPPKMKEIVEMEYIKDDSSIKSVEVTLLIDSLERIKDDFGYVHQVLSNTKIPVRMQRLEIGDYQWSLVVTRTDDSITEYALGKVVERKIADDLSASIFDGRYIKQRMKMVESNAQCMYLLEGTKSTSMSEKLLISAVMKTSTLPNMQVVITENFKETGQFLTHMTQHLQQEIMDTYTKTDLRNLKTFSNFQSECKTRKTVGSFFGHALRSIRGLGPTSLQGILDTFHTPMSLKLALEKAKEEGNRGNKQLNYLKTIKINGQSISRKVLEDIISLYG